MTTATAHNIEVYLNGVLHSVQKGSTALAVSRQINLVIPTLCAHPAVSASGACRLCVVEVKERGLFSACTLVVEQDMWIETESDLVCSSRKQTIRYLLKRAPRDACLLELAREYGVLALSDTEDSVQEGNKKSSNCVLCGLCVRACFEHGSESMQFVGKGIKKEVKCLEPEQCSKCMLCEKLCPTGAIEKIRSAIEPRNETS